MILIKDITVENHPNKSGIEILQEAQENAFPHQMPEQEIKIIREQVFGRRYRNVNGENVCIGMTKKVQDALGLPFNEFEYYSERIADLQLLYNELYNKVNKAGFFKRLAYLFTGRLK